MNISPPAFPTWIADDSMVPGMTLRDYFAAQALTGLLTESSGDFSNDAIAQLAYSLADGMLKARNA